MKPLLALLCLFLLAGCTRNTVRSDYKRSDFTWDDFRISHSVLTTSGDVRVLAFKKSFASLFPSPDSAAALLERAILDSMHRKPAISVRPAPVGFPPLPAEGADSLDPAAGARLDTVWTALGARYLIHIRNITVTNSTRENPRVVLPGIGGMEPAGGGSSERCVVFLTVEIRRVPGLRLEYAFTVQANSEADLSTARAALGKALDGAARATAAHLRGY
jgi:hypothetical protein